MGFPTNTQELFEFAIAKARTAISEFGVFNECLSLLAWAEWYANQNKLDLPSLESFAIYAELYESEIEFLNAERAKWADRL